MKKIILLITLCLVWVTSFAELTPFPKKSSIPPDGCLYGYYEYLPDGYEQRNDWPIVVFLHGTGEAGNGTTELSRVLRHGLPKNIAAGQKYPFVAFIPQNSGGWFTTSNLVGSTNIWQNERSVLTHIKRTYKGKIDLTRIYVAGLSAGGKGTMQMAEFAVNDIAAAIAICPAGGGGREYVLKNTPVWFFVNSGDNFYPTTKSLYESVQRVAVDKFKVKLTVYATSGHDAWTKSCNDPATWEWLLSHRLGGIEAPPVTPVASITQVKLQGLIARREVAKLDSLISILK